MDLAGPWPWQRGFQRFGGEFARTPAKAGAGGTRPAAARQTGWTLLKRRKAGMPMWSEDGRTDRDPSARRWPAETENAAWRHLGEQPGSAPPSARGGCDELIRLCVRHQCAALLVAQEVGKRMLVRSVAELRAVFNVAASSTRQHGWLKVLPQIGVLHDQGGEIRYDQGCCGGVGQVRHQRHAIRPVGTTPKSTTTTGRPNRARSWCRMLPRERSGSPADLDALLRCWPATRAIL